MPRQDYSEDYPQEYPSEYRTGYHPTYSRQQQLDFQSLVKSLDSKTVIKASIWLFTASFVSLGTALLFAVLRPFNKYMFADYSNSTSCIPTISSGLAASVSFAGAGLLLLASTKAHLRLGEYFSENYTTVSIDNEGEDEARRESARRAIVQHDLRGRPRTSSVHDRWARADSRLR